MSWFICSRRRVAVTRHRMICLVLQMMEHSDEVLYMYNDCYSTKCSIETWTDYFIKSRFFIFEKQAMAQDMETCIPKLTDFVNDSSLRPFMIWNKLLPMVTTNVAVRVTSKYDIKLQTNRLDVHMFSPHLFQWRIIRYSDSFPPVMDFVLSSLKP